MKLRILGWSLAFALALGVGLWFWLMRSAEVRESLLRDVDGDLVAPMETALFFSTPSVPSDIGVNLVPVVRKLKHPVDLVFLPGERLTLVILEQAGSVRFSDLTSTQPKAHQWFQVSVNDRATEQGLLGLTFHPQFRENGRLFLNYTTGENQRAFSIVSEWHADPKAPLSKPAQFKREVLRLEQPFVNHNGGCLRFGPDNMLYVGWGDGGAANDPLNEGQQGSGWLGSILRIDVDSAESYRSPSDNPFIGRSDVRPETFAIGVRNPWRFTFAPDGRMVVADVGQEDWEEIGFALPGDNLGWRRMEGLSCFHTKACDKQGLRLPFHVYGHDQGGSITGGEVVLSEGPLSGLYVFGDYLSGRLWALALPRELEARVTPVPLGEWPVHPSTFGRDREGRVYLADHMRGIVYRIDAAQ